VGGLLGWVRAVEGGAGGAGGVDWGGALEGEVDVDEGGHGLDVVGGLGVVEEVFLAGLVFGVPFENVELVAG